MKKLTLKIYLKELFQQLIVFAILSLLFFFLRTDLNPFTRDILLGLLYSFPVLLSGLTYCILFYHLVFKKLLIKVPFKKLLSPVSFLIVSFFIADFLIMNIILFHRETNYHIEWPNLYSLFRFIVFAVYAVAYSTVKGLIWLRMQKLQTEKENVQASLQNLRSQIDPHFIFNSLNNVYGLALEENAQKTAQSIEELSSLFRYTLKDSHVEKISIKEELDFMEKFIHMHRIRIAENQLTKLDTNISWDKTEAEIAPLLMIIFIENAFKYGISSIKESLININITVKNRTVNLMVENTVHKNDQLKNGLGLINVRKRLDFLYNGKYLLSETDNGNMHKVVLDINLT